MSANIDLAMYLPTVQILWAVLRVHAFPGTVAMVFTAKVSFLKYIYEIFVYMSCDLIVCTLAMSCCHLAPIKIYTLNKNCDFNSHVIIHMLI